MGNFCSVSRSKDARNDGNNIMEVSEESISKENSKINSEKYKTNLENKKDSENSSIQNGCITKENSIDRTPKSIKFAESPQYLKMKLAPEVPNDEVPNMESVYQSPIKLKNRYFDPIGLELSKKKIVSFETLIGQLINENEAIKTDLDKVRAAFTWLTNKNANEAHLEYLNDTNSALVDIDSPEMYFHSLCIGRYTYAQFFQLLCRYAGLKCKLLRGYAKGNDFKPGMKLEGGKTAQHAWNSVKIDDIWYLFDTHWTARRLVNKNRVNSSNLDLFYFMVHPEDMKFSHHPFESDWQMLRHPLSLEEFERLCIVKPAFFKFGLQFRSHHESLVTVDNNDVKIELGYATEPISQKTCFTFTLKNDTKSTEMFEGTLLNKYGIVETIKVTNNLSKVRFWLRFPELAVYKIMIFAKSVNDEMFSGVCEYQISYNSINPIDRPVDPFPPTQQTTYGSTELVYKYNITSSWDNKTMIETKDDGTFEVEFTSYKKLPTNCYPRLMARLRCTKLTESELSQRLLIRTEAPNNSNIIENESDIGEIVKVKGFLPDTGEYALEIYANNPETESSSFYLIWQHLIICEKPFTEKLPLLTPGLILGAQDSFRRLGLKALTHNDPLIYVKQDKEIPYADLSICIAIPKAKPDLTKDQSKKEPNLKILGQLLDISKQTSDEDQELGGLMLQQININNNEHDYDEAEFLIRLNETGYYYRLYLYAMTTEDEVDTMPLVITYLIYASPTECSQDSLKGIRYHEFPEQTNQWKEDCRLIRPINKRISIPKTGKFKSELMEMIVPNAVKVASVIDKQWIQFEKICDTKYHWRGKIIIDCTTSPGTVMTIYANYSERYNSYIPLLEYELI